jgi:hypothetical protein
MYPPQVPQTWRPALLALLAAPVVACSLIVSTDGLSGTALGDAGMAADAGSNDGTSANDAATEASANDAGVRYRDAVLADGPVAYWRLDGPGPTVPDEMGRYPGTIKGTVATGVPGALSDNTAMRFDGTTGFIEFGDVLDFPGKKPFSIEAWISPDIVDATYRTAIGKIILLPGGYNGYSLLLQQTLALKFTLCVDQTDCPSPTTTAPALGRFTHVVLTYDGSLGNIYYDGTLVATLGYPETLIDNDTGFHIGAENKTGYFKGAIDEVAVYDKTLAPPSIAAHFAARR